MPSASHQLPSVARLLVGLVLSVAGLGRSQSPTPAPAPSLAEPEQLTELRETFEAQLLAAVAPLRDDCARKLEELENVRAIREDYEGALRARDLRKRMVGDGESGEEAPTGGDPPGTRVLPMRGALLSGNTVSYDATRDALTGFKKARHSATWNLIKVVPGWYDVVVTYGCADVRTERRERRTREEDTGPVELKAGGTFAFAEVTNLIKDTSPPIRRTVVSTGGWDKLVTRNIGKLRLTATTATLELEAVEPESEGIMYLRSLKLVPSREPGAGSDVVDDSGEPAELQELREQYRRQVEVELADKITAYVSELKELEDKYSRESKLDEALEARTERMRAQLLLSDPAAVIRK